MRSTYVRSIFKFVSIILLVFILAACTTKATETEPAPSVPAESEVQAEPTPDVDFGQDGEPPRNPAQNTVMANFTTEDFSGAGTCVMCHATLFDELGNDVSITNDWRSTMMANAATDPVWQAKVSSEIARNPDLEAVIEDKCISCHQPMAYTQAEVNGTEQGMFGDGFVNPDNPLHAAAMDGVSCSLCHQVIDTNLGEKESFSGDFEIDASTNPPTRPMYGPYEEPFKQTMEAHTGFSPEFAAHTGTAEMCATCHNLFTPYVDADGNVLGEFPEQTPYTEWESSQFGANEMHCQSCHMPQASGGVVISLMPGNLPAREPFFKHYFVGGNAFILGILSDWGADLGVAADKAQFDTTIARVKEQVGKRSASLMVESAEVSGNNLNATLKITPFTGHKFPTSFPSRRVWLHVTVTDATGKVVFESGKHNWDGTITGNAADEDPAAYEPHYDLITSADQVQIYEPIMVNSDGDVTYTLLRAAAYIKDNRILPNGADKATLSPDIAVYGAALEDANFNGGGDMITYQIDVSNAQGPFTFNAELLYEPLSYRFIQDMFTDDTPEINQFEGFYGETLKQPLLSAMIEPVVVK
jgi:hypothetical protein